jgi:hypothetical protein
MEFGSQEWGFDEDFTLRMTDQILSRWQMSHVTQYFPFNFGFVDLVATITCRASHTFNFGFVDIRWA